MSNKPSSPKKNAVDSDSDTKALMGSLQSKFDSQRSSVEVLKSFLYHKSLGARKWAQLVNRHRTLSNPFFLLRSTSKLYTLQHPTVPVVYSAPGEIPLDHTQRTLVYNEFKEFINSKSQNLAEEIKTLQVSYEKVKYSTTSVAVNNLAKRLENSKLFIELVRNNDITMQFESQAYLQVLINPAKKFNKEIDLKSFIVSIIGDRFTLGGIEFQTAKYGTIKNFAVFKLRHLNSQFSVDQLLNLFFDTPVIHYPNNGKVLIFDQETNDDPSMDAKTNEFVDSYYLIGWTGYKVPVNRIKNEPNVSLHIVSYFSYCTKCRSTLHTTCNQAISIPRKRKK